MDSELAPVDPVKDASSGVTADDKGANSPDADSLPDSYISSGSPGGLHDSSLCNSGEGEGTISASHDVVVSSDETAGQDEGQLEEQSSEGKVQTENGSAAGYIASIGLLAGAVVVLLAMTVRMSFF